MTFLSPIGSVDRKPLVLGVIVANRGSHWNRIGGILSQPATRRQPQTKVSVAH